MSKWIAEFELEDGDIMPEHMELEYRGARIDFHCKPLEQEPILDKIRDEIEQDALSDVNGGKFIFVNRINQIIDKYKGESEG